MPTLFVYLPCYNEAGNLRRLTEEWLAEAEALARLVDAMKAKE